METPCPSCKTLLQPSFFFCPQCGKKIHEPPVSTTITTQLLLYIFAILVPPFGIIPAAKYLADKNPQAKTIGIILAVLTVIVTIITTWLAYSMYLQLQKMVGSQLYLQTPQGLGL